MKRVGALLARGIVVSAVLLTGGPLIDPGPSRTTRALGLVRSQDFTPIFGIAGRRVSDYFDPKKETLFLDEVFSLSGKWKAVTRGRASYERYIRKVFEEKIFSARDFDEVLEQIRADYRTARRRRRTGCWSPSTTTSDRRDRTELREVPAGVRELAASIAPHVVRDLG
jgi:hypothetical protein